MNKKNVLIIFITFAIFLLWVYLNYNKEYDYSLYSYTTEYNGTNFKIESEGYFYYFEETNSIECIDFIVEKYPKAGIAASILTFSERDITKHIKETIGNQYNITFWSTQNKFNKYENVYIRKYAYRYESDIVKIDYVFIANNKLFEIRIGYHYDSQCFFLDKACKQKESEEKLAYIENTTEPWFFEHFEIK